MAKFGKNRSRIESDFPCIINPQDTKCVLEGQNHLSQTIDFKTFMGNARAYGELPVRKVHDMHTHLSNLVIWERASDRSASLPSSYTTTGARPFGMLFGLKFVGEVLPRGETKK